MGFDPDEKITACGACTAESCTGCPDDDPCEDFSE